MNTAIIHALDVGIILSRRKVKRRNQMRIEATIVNVNSTHDCTALVKGERILVDPFVTNAWEWEYRNNLLGSWILEGWWWESEYSEDKCFLVEKVIPHLR
jgi:hypothetical protein